MSKMLSQSVFPPAFRHLSIPVLLSIRRAMSSHPHVILGLQIFRNLLFSLFVLRSARKLFLQLKGRGIFGTAAEAYNNFRSLSFGLFLRIPVVRAKVRKEIADATEKLQSKLAPSGPSTIRHLGLPSEGWSSETVLEELQDLATMAHTRWEDGYVSGAVYHGGEELMELQTQAFGKFTVANPIHPDVFPGVRKMEAEIVSMVLKLFNAPLDAAGVTTSGGTESILMACFSARQKAYVERNITEPEMIMPETAHPAFRKAAQYFGFKLHLVASPAPSYQVDVSAIRRFINSNTALLVGSAPNFPHGIIDDIPGLSKLALKYNIPLHVDCCLGSFVIAFLEKSGFESLLFDFRCPGVTSISCDTHKYGFAPKGSSTVLYRSAALRSYQYFIVPEWSGGVYASPSIAGSRPGALIAGCWASLMKVGENGYVESCKAIVSTTRKIACAIHDHPELEVLGSPLVSVVAFTSSTLDIYDIADGMSAKGWHLNSLQSPPAMHVAVTLPVARAWEQLVSDLKAVVEEEKAKKEQRILEGKDTKSKSKGDSAALYGVAGSLPNKSIVVELSQVFLDTLYKA